MNIIRPIQPADLDMLKRIAEQSGPGFTSLPSNDQLLQKKLDRSIRSLNKEVQQPGDEAYLFASEDTRTGQMTGVCGIQAAVGMRDPWYLYRIGTIVHASRKLNIHNCFQTLYLCNDYTAHSEIGSLYLLPEYRRDRNGTLLSKSRFLFMAAFPERFADTVIAEMRGVSDERGRSPFWEGLGRHFFTMAFSEADYLTGIGNKAFIAELMPKHSIYIHLLPEEAQRVIAQVHKNTQPARKILENEGFHYEGYIDIFDGGPTLVCRTQKIHSIRYCGDHRVRIKKPIASGEPCLVSNTQLRSFRCTLAPLHLEKDHVCVSPQLANALRVDEGDSLKVVPLDTTRRPSS